MHLSAINTDNKFDFLNVINTFLDLPKNVDVNKNYDVPDQVSMNENISDQNNFNLQISSNNSLNENIIDMGISTSTQETQ